MGHKNTAKHKASHGFQLKLLIISLVFGISFFSNSQTYKTIDGSMFSAKIPTTFVFDEIDSNPDYCNYESSSAGIKLIEFNSLNKYRFELDNIEDLYAEAVKNSKLKISYTIQKYNWFIISGTNSNGNIVYWKRVIGDNFVSDLYIEYSSANKSSIEKHIGEISRSFISL